MAFIPFKYQTLIGSGKTNFAKIYCSPYPFASINLAGLAVALDDAVAREADVATADKIWG